MNKIRNREGSTLLMSLLITVVLVLLGTTALSMAFMNLNRKYYNEKSLKAAYYSESGIDQVYAMLGSKIEEVLEEARSETDSYQRALLAYLETTVSLDHENPVPIDLSPGQVKEGAVFSDPQDSSMHFTEINGLKDGTDYIQFYIQDEDRNIFYEDKILNSDALIQVLDDHYRHAFMDIFDERYSDTIENAIESLSGLTYQGNSCTIRVQEGIVNFSSSGNNSFRISGIESEFTYGEDARKTISTNLKILAPDQLYPIVTQQDKISVEDNPIWQNALVSNQDISFEGEVEVKGDLYAYGTKGNGIYLEENAKVNVIGDMITNANIQAVGQASQLIVQYGSLYCSTLMTEEGAVNSGIKTYDTNVYTRDDLAINAEKSHIAINDGSYYGFSDGSEIGSSYNTSSSIIINVPLYKQGDPTGFDQPATLKIDGTQPRQNKDGQLYKKKEQTTDPGVWIFGTAYVNTTGPDSHDKTVIWPFQTGESVSIRGNYIAYTLPLFSAKETKYNEEYIVTSKSEIGFEPAVGEIFTNPTIPTYFTVKDKTKYFMEAYASYQDLIDVGDPSSLNINNYKYVPGVKIHKDGHVDYEYDGETIEAFHRLKTEIKQNYLHYLYNTFEYTEGGEIYEDYPGDDFDVLKKHMDESNQIIDIRSSEKYLFDDSKNATQIIYAANSPEYKDQKLRIVGENAPYYRTGYTDIKTDASSNTGYFQGIIISQGDVLIEGDVNFAGTIIAGGDIIIKGGKSSFHNSEKATIELLADMIRKSSGLKNIFKKGSTGKRIEFNRLEVIPSENEDNKNSYKQLLELNQWRIQ